MSDINTPTDSVSDGASKPKGLLIACLLTSAIVGWLFYSYPPKTWRIPEELANVNAMSPEPEKAKLAAVEVANLWNNTMMKFTMAGLGIALGALLLNGAKNIPGTAATIVGGLVFGLLAGVIGLLVRQYLNKEYPIPLVPASSRPLFCDTVVLSIMGTLLMVPLAILMRTQSSSKDRGRAGAVLAGGALSGLLVPFIVAIAMPSVSTSFFPPAGLAVPLIWFLSMGLVTTALAVFREAKAPTPSAEAELETA